MAGVGYIHFGPYRVHPLQGLFRDDIEVHVTPKALAVLYMLAQRPQEVVTKAELFDQVWFERVVSDSTLSACVWEIRHALGDSARKPLYIETLHGRGFRMRMATIVDAAETVLIRRQAGDDPAPALPIDLSLPSQPSIVILPFDVGECVDRRYFALGLTHDINTRIARTRSFFVIARGSASLFSPRTHDVREVSRLLGVRYVVHGNVRFDASRVRIDLVLADGVEGREIWADTFRCRLGGVFETQEEITDQIVGTISAEVEQAERERALLETPANLEAWSAYHRGCWHMFRFTPDDYKLAKNFFDLSISLDPNSPRAFAGLSFVHWQRAFLDISSDRSADVRRALELAQHSVSLNPQDPLGHWALGRAHLLQGKMDESLSELEVSTSLNPSFAIGQYTLGFALMHAGNTVDSIERADRARRLSPYDPMGFAMIGVRAFSLAMSGRFSEAAELMALAVRQPNSHFHMVAMAAVCDMLAGNDDAARNDMARLGSVRPGYGEGEFLRAFPLQSPDHVRLVQKAFQRLGRL